MYREVLIRPSSDGTTFNHGTGTDPEPSRAAADRGGTDEAVGDIVDDRSASPDDPQAQATNNDTPNRGISLIHL
jgi:hypothetical protein